MAYNDNNNNCTEELKIHEKFVKFALGNLGRLNCTILVPTHRCACFRILLNGHNEEENESILDKILDVLKVVEDKLMEKHEENDEKHFSKVQFKVTLQMLIPEEKCGYVNDCDLTLATIDRQIYEPIPGFERLILQSEKVEGLRQARKEIGNLLRCKTREISLKGQTFDEKRFSGERDDFMDKITRNNKQFRMDQREVEMEMTYPEKVAKILHDIKICHGPRNYEISRILSDGTRPIINKDRQSAIKAIEAKLDEFNEELANKMKNEENGKESVESESSETNSSKNGKCINEKKNEIHRFCNDAVKDYEQGQSREAIVEKNDEVGNGKSAKNENVTMRKKEENNKKLLRSRSIVKTKPTKAAEKIMATMRARSISVSQPKKQVATRTAHKYEHQTNNEKEASPALSHSTSGSSGPQPSPVVEVKSKKENLPVKKNDKKGLGLNEKGPECLLRRQEYVKKNWEPKANLNIEQNEGNKKCILDLAKAKHKIGQQQQIIEKDELIRQFERKLSSNCSEESMKSSNSSTDEKKTNGKARNYDGMNKMPPAMLELANKIVATLSCDFVRGYKLAKFKSDFLEDHNQNIEEEAQKLGYNSLEEMLESNEMKSKIFWKDEENDDGSKSRIYRAKRNKLNADIYKQQSNAELEKRKKKEKNLRIFEKLYGVGVGQTKVHHGKQMRKSLDSHSAK